MAVTFDITEQYESRVFRTDSFYIWSHGQQIHQLQGEIREWLNERGHDAQFVNTPAGVYNNYTITFEDESLAVLFKLTWL